MQAALQAADDGIAPSSRRVNVFWAVKQRHSSAQRASCR